MEFKNLLIFSLLIFFSVVNGNGTKLYRFFHEHIDSNRDGFLDRQDFRKWACRMDETLCEEQSSLTELNLLSQIRYIVNQMDRNNDQKISWSEFKEHFGKNKMHSFKEPIMPGPQQIHLSFGEDPSSQIVVMWVTTDQSNTIVQYGLQSNQYSMQATGTLSTYNVGVDGWYGWIHTVFLNNLNPSTTYYYRVGAESDWSGEFQFTTAPNTPKENLTFATMGDMGTFIPMGWAVTDRMVQDNQQYHFSMVLHVGDVCYAGTGSTWEFEEVWDIWFNQVQDLAARVPYVVSVGNHEHYYNYTSYRSRFLNPGAQKDEIHQFWWSLPVGNINFISISTEHDSDPGSPQYMWLESALQKANADRKNRPWLIVSGHRPMYSSDVDEWNSHKPGAHFQTVIEPLFLKYNVDLYICGHMHMYERVYPVINGTVMSSGDVWKNPGATAHVNQATGGVFLDTQYIDPVPDWSASRMSRWGYGLFQASNSLFHYQFIDQVDGITLDEFWIIKE